MRRHPTLGGTWRQFVRCLLRRLAIGPQTIAAAEILDRHGIGLAPIAGRMKIELLKKTSRGGETELLSVQTVQANEPFYIHASGPDKWRSGTRTLRVGVEGPEGLAVGVTMVTRGVEKAAAINASAGQ